MTTLIRSILVLDMVGSSTKLKTIEELLGVEAARAPIQELDKMLVAAMAAEHVPRSVMLKYVGDGVILAFEQAEAAHRIAAHMHKLSQEKNSGLTMPIAFTRFRIGIATGEVTEVQLQLAPNDLAGSTIVMAARFEAAGSAGGIVICPRTYDALTSEQRALYQGPKTYKAKAEAYPGYICLLHADAKPDVEHASDKNGQSSSSHETPRNGSAKHASNEEVIAWWTARLRVELPELPTTWLQALRTQLMKTWPHEATKIDARDALLDWFLQTPLKDATKLFNALKHSAAPTHGAAAQRWASELALLLSCRCFDFSVLRERSTKRSVSDSATNTAAEVIEVKTYSKLLCAMTLSGLKGVPMLLGSGATTEHFIEVELPANPQIAELKDYLLEQVYVALFGKKAIFKAVDDWARIANYFEDRRGDNVFCGIFVRMPSSPLTPQLRTTLLTQVALEINDLVVGASETHDDSQLKSEAETTIARLLDRVEELLKSILNSAYVPASPL
jgi:class 3 adenylate cyclase